MRDLEEWSPQIPAEKIVNQAREILVGASWDTARKVEAAAKVGQRAAEVVNMKDHMKAMKQATLWAERRLGELLREMDKTCGRPKKRFPDGTFLLSTYADLGITKKQAFRWQKIAEVDEKTFQQIVEETPTATAVLKAAATETPSTTATPSPKANDKTDSTVDTEDSEAIQPSVTSLKNLVQYIQELVISEKTVLLYLYYCIYGHTAPTQQEIKSHTRLNFKTIRTHTKVLETLAGIKLVPQGRHTKVQVVNITPPTSSSYSSISSLLDIRSQREQARRTLSGALDSNTSGTSARKKTGGVSNVNSFTVADIESDEDWQKAKVPLEKYFQKFELDPVALTRKKRFSKLIELVLDETFEFDAYCEWYSETKYSDKGFNFGLFLHHGVIEEFRFAYKQDGRYLRTSSDIGNSESFKQGVERTKEFIDSLEDE